MVILLSDSSDSAARQSGTDLSQNELGQLDDFLADHPQDEPTRMARGRRLLEAGDLSAALDEYLAVLEEGPDAEAMAFVGWITYASGETALAEQILEESLTIDPQSLTATWFLANIKYYGTQDVAGAIPLLEQVLTRTDAEADMIEAARAMLAEADVP